MNDALTFGSLFSGIGGLDLGLERAGLGCRWQVEADSFCRRVLTARWPHVWRFDDARAFPPARDDLRVDLIVGGDPCQENSAQRIAPGVSQASLGAEFLRIVGALRPRLVLRENPTRTRPDAPWPWRRFRDGLLDLGYLVLPFRLRACCLGLDHQRDRMFLLAALPDADREHAELLPQPRSGQVEAGAGEGGRRERERLRAEPGPALRDPRHPVHGRASGRLDGLPKGLGERLLRGYGNAVPPAMGEFIGRRLVEHHRSTG